MKISENVRGILERAATDGPVLRIAEQLERADYEAVNKVLAAAGGKWSRRDRGHVFQDDAGPVLAGLLSNGEVATPQEAGWFPTPPAIVTRILDAAGIEPRDHRMTALEPSAGTGAISQRAAGYGYLVDCIELDPMRADHLKFGCHARNVWIADFLQVPPRPEYDRVLMNPPFAGKADLAHVTHALKFLKPGGRLVAVMSAGTSFRSDKRTAAFRELVEQAGGTIERLPEGAFEESGTGVHTVLVTIPAVEQAAELPAEQPAEQPKQRGRLSRDEARAKVDEKRARVAALMADGLEALTGPQTWLTFLARGHSLARYSFRNQLLIGMQCPVASDVAGYVEWTGRGRQVRDGEEGILIFAPRTKKAAVDANGEIHDRAPEPGEDSTRRMCGVKVASVFDISQTDPMPGRVFKPAPTAQAKTFTEIRATVAAMQGDDAARVLAAMDEAAELLAVQAAQAAELAAEDLEALDEDEAVELLSA